jgi:hypothetical protein
VAGLTSSDAISFPEEGIMIKFELLKDAGVLVVQPQSALSADDFREVARVVNPYISERGKLTGLLIEAASFPGWESFGALIEHLRFVTITIAASIGSLQSPTTRSSRSHRGSPNTLHIPRSGSSEPTRRIKRSPGCKAAHKRLP